MPPHISSHVPAMPSVFFVSPHACCFQIAHQLPVHPLPHGKRSSRARQAYLACRRLCDRQALCARHAKHETKPAAGGCIKRLGLQARGVPGHRSGWGASGGEGSLPGSYCKHHLHCWLTCPNQRHEQPAVGAVRSEAAPVSPATVNRRRHPRASSEPSRCKSVSQSVTTQ